MSDHMRISLGSDNAEALDARLRDIAAAIRDPWNPDSLAKDLFLRLASGESPELKELARLSIRAANIFCTALKESKESKP